MDEEIRVVDPIITEQMRQELEILVRNATYTTDRIFALDRGRTNPPLPQISHVFSQIRRSCSKWLIQVVSFQQILLLGLSDPKSKMNAMVGKYNGQYS